MKLAENVSMIPADSQSAVSPGDPFAERLRGFGPMGLLAIVVILLGNAVVVPLSAVLVLLWAKRTQTPWREIGYVRPKSWTKSFALGMALGIAFKLLLKAIVMPLLVSDPVNHAYHYVAGNPAALPGMLYAIIIGAGFGEETVFRGYMFERLGKLLGSGTGAKVAIVLITSALFGLAHYPNQGFPGVEQGLITGLVFGTIFAVTGRLWPIMCAHAAFDLTALAIIYWNLEADIGHFIFK